MALALAAITLVAFIFILAGIVLRGLVVILSFGLVLIVFILLVLHLGALSSASSFQTSQPASPRGCSNPETIRRTNARRNPDNARRNIASWPAARCDSRWRLNLSFSHLPC